jgi:ATP-dependent exoDNAse (exonuclease V) alpha subunit
VAPQVAQERVVSLVRNIRDRARVDPDWECQVVVAVNEKSPLSRRELNAILQAELNGRNRAEGARFWKDDKVICLKNSRFPAVLDLTDLDDDALEGFVQVREDEGIGQGVELYVANGELGRVVEDSPTKMIVEFLHPRRVVLVPKVGGSSEDGDAEGSAANFDLGYAISVHKSQGSEWPVVIVALDDSGGARMVCDRSWIYTAISRARKACFLVGQLSTIEAMCRRQKIGQRKTFLVERFQDEVEKLLVAAKAKAMAKDALEEKREEREVAGGVDSGEVGAEAGADGETGKATATETVPCPV